MHQARSPGATTRRPWSKESARGARGRNRARAPLHTTADVFARLPRGVAIVGRANERTDGGALRRSRITRGVLAVFAGLWLLASPASMMPRAQSSWPFQLEWTQTGSQASYYRLCVNGACTVLSDARNTQGNVWRAALPVLPPGEYRLVVEACGDTVCQPGEPDMVIRVVPSSPRRPAIDVIDGPRIPVSR